MKKKILSIAFAMAFMITCSFCLASCGVVPCAWVKLDMEGYVIYTTHMSPAYGHIFLYENEEAAQNDTYSSNYELEIDFDPRILGPDVSVPIEERTTTVDLSKGYCEMKVYIRKAGNTYGAEKHVYLNGEALTPTSTYDSESLLILDFEDINLLRGNPGGHRNDIINIIEYK